MKKSIWFLFLLITIGCSQKPKRLPFLGNPIIKGNDTLYPKIKDFSFIDQDSIVVTNKTFENKIYVADFIFLSCPTICPKMHTELSSVYNIYKNNPNILFLSHTIDPEHDTIERLKAYTKSNKISNKWHFVTGNRDSIYSIATKSYFATAYKDSKEPGGYVHSGGFLLIDKNRHIRGVYDGTNPEETKRLIRDIKVLLSE
ncbi:SCO family protein [Flavobacterium sp.]|jgi:protein SCO1/2|uniref:SCO family protein n=1 Tax=Flavobacterium sp. TaxID=239 RepID=UPI0037BF9E68